MFSKAFKKEILTIPNLLTALRLALIPVYVRLYLGATQDRQFRAAGLIIALSCLTDALDGKIARRFRMQSTLGQILDPIADKLTQLALTICLSLRYPMLQPVLALFLVKEVFQTLLAIVSLRRGKMLPGALMAGKLCTAVLFVSLTALVLFPHLSAPLVTAIASVNGFFLTVSFAGYVSAYLGKHPLVRDIQTE